MKHISDQTLSAFFDNELSAQDMDAVREALFEDPDLADRLAQIALVDEQVKLHATSMDKHPVPAATLQLLASSQSDTPRWWQSIGHRRFASSGQHLAIAASIFVVLGGLAGYWLIPETHTQNPWLLVEEQLSSVPSGRTVELADGQQFTSQFSFHSETGELCRVYQLEYNQRAESIACWNSNSGWQNILTTYSPLVGDGEYSLAAGSGLLQQQVTALQASPPLSLEQERKALQHIDTK